MPAVRFCSACGAELPSRPPVTCASCGTSHWRNPKPGAGAIVVRDERVLLIRRAHTPWKGYWAAPSGFCDEGEHPIETAEREAREETGYDVEVTGYLGVWVHKHADDPGLEGTEVINVSYYHAAPEAYAVSQFDPSEVSEVGWFPWSELPVPLAPPGTLDVVLRAAREAHERGTARSDVRDRPH